METKKFVYYREEDMFIGWLEEFPDYRRPLHNSSIVIAVSQSPELSEGEAKQSHNALISHEIAASLCSSQ